MVHSALKIKTLTEARSFYSLSRDSSRDAVLPLSRKASSSADLLPTPPVNPSPSQPPPPPPPIPFLLEMMTPYEFAIILRTRVNRLISQWSQYTSQPPFLVHHGLPSPSSSGSPLVQQSQTLKKLDPKTISSFVSFFYPEEHQIHQSGDLSSETLFAHLEGLQTLLSFLSSKELGVIIKNRLSSSSPNRAVSIQAVVEVIRSVSVDDEENEDLDSTWKQFSRKTTTPPVQPQSASIELPIDQPTKSFVDVAVATDPSFDSIPSTTVPVVRSSSSDGSRPSKRPKYVASHPLFQDSTDDYRTVPTSISSFNSPSIDLTHDHPHVSGPVSSSISMSIPMPKMADPILRPVSTRSFKSPPITLPLDDDGEADAEGDTDTDIDMNVDLTVDVNEHDDDSKNLTIAQVINSCRSEEAIVNILKIHHPLIKNTLESRSGASSETPFTTPSVAATTAATVTTASSSSSSFANLIDISGNVPSSSRHADIPRGPRAMRSLLSNESTYSVPSSSSSRTPSMPNLINLSRTSPSNATTSSTMIMPVTTPQVKKELLSTGWEMATTRMINKNAAEMREIGTRQYPIELIDQSQDDPSQQSNEQTSRRVGPLSFPLKANTKKLQHSFAQPPLPLQSTFVAPHGPPVPSSLISSSSVSEVLKYMGIAPLRYEGPELPPSDDVVPTNVSSKPLETDTTDTAASSLTIQAIQSRSKASGKGNKKPAKSPRYSGRSQKSLSRSRSSSLSSCSVEEKRHRLPQKKSLTTKYESQTTRSSNGTKHSHSQSDRRTWDSSSRSRSSRSSSRSESRPRVPYRPRNYSYSRPPSPSSAKDRHWSPEPSRRNRERGRSKSRRRRGEDNPSASRTSNGMDHWSPGRDPTTRSSNTKTRSARA